jgi:hypothetical protein
VRLSDIPEAMKTQPIEKTRETALKLLAYCRSQNWAGYDPYDALNSRILEILPVLNSRLPRLVLIQALKRSPINPRRLLFVPKTQNPKGIALFLASLLKLRPEDVADRQALIDLMIERLSSLRSPHARYACWGYNFPWQTRTVVIPRGEPNLVSTVFAADALLDAYEDGQGWHCLSLAVSAADYIANELYWTDGPSRAGFSYPQASLRLQIHNANFLGAALLSRVYRLTGQSKYIEPALQVARYSARSQNADGSWPYGEAPTQQWIDNFHTGYNLCSLQAIGRHLETAEFDSCIRRGFEFYRARFFREDGAVRYFHDSTYPIDVHCVAQSIITLLAFREYGEDNIRLAHSVFEWARAHMWDEKGFFYYRVLRFGTIRTPYMRWSEAWMLLALSALIDATAASPSATRMDTTAVLVSSYEA